MAGSRLPAFVGASVAGAAPSPPPAPAPEPAVAPAGPLLLPFELKVKAARTTKIHIELDCAVTDARGASVQHLPLAVDIKTTLAEIEAILLATVKQMAEAFERRGAAVLLPQVDMTSAPALQELVGRIYKGSVAR